MSDILKDIFPIVKRYEITNRGGKKKIFILTDEEIDRLRGIEGIKIKELKNK